MLEELYKLYLDNGIISDAISYDMFFQSNEQQQQGLYDLGVAQGLFETTDLNTFKTAWSQKKNASQEADGESVLEAGTSVQPESPTTPRIPTGETDTAIERTFGKNAVTDFFGDMYRSYKTGVAQGASVDDAFAVFGQGKEVSDEALDDFRQAVNTMQRQGPTDELREYYKDVEKEGGGILGTIKALGNNLGVAPQVLISSMTGLFNPISLGAAATGAAAGAGAGAGLTALSGPGALFGAGTGALGGAFFGASGMLETATTFTELLQKELGDKPFTNENIRDVLEDEEKISSIKRKSVGRGVTIGAIEALTSGLAGRIGANVVKSALPKLISRPASVVASGLIEGAGGALGERAGMAVAGQEVDAAEIGLEAVGGGPITAAKLLNPLFRLSKKVIPGKAKYIKDGQNITKEFVEEFIEKADDAEIINFEVDIQNDAALKQRLENKKLEAKQNVQIEDNFKKAYPNISQEDLNTLIPLQRELDNAKNNPVDTESKEKELREKINKITNKYANQVESPAAVPDEKQPATGQAVVEGDNQPTELAGETAQAQEETADQQGQEGQVETEVSETETVEETRKKELDDSQVTKSAEIFEVVDNDGDIMTVEVRTKLDGSRSIRLKDGDGDLVSEVKLSKDNTLSNKEHIEKSYGEIKSSELKSGTSIMTQKKIDRLSPRQKKALGLLDTTRETTKDYEQILDSEVSNTSLKSIIQSLRKSNPDSSAIDLLSDVYNKKTIDDFNYDYLNKDNITYRDLTDVLVSEEIYETTKEAIDKISSIGKGIVLKDVSSKIQDDVNTKIDTTKLPLFQYKKKKYRKVESLKKPEGVSLYIEEGKPLFVDKYGTHRPTATEKNQMTGIYMSDSMLRPIKDQAQESKTTITESEDITSIPIDNKFVARIKDNKVVEIADNDGNVVDEATARKLEKKIIDKQIIPLAETDFISQERIEQQALEDTIESSKSPRQIANVIQQLQRVDKTETQIKKSEVKDSYSGLGAMFALGVKFTPESVKEQTGSANLKKEFGFPFMQSWIRKDGVSILDGFVDENGKKYTADQVENFITEYKTQKQYVDKADDTSGPLLDAKEKFTELTGLKATATNIKKVAESPSIEELQDQAFLEERKIERDKIKGINADAKKIIDDEVKRIIGEETPVDTEERKEFLADIKKQVDVAIERLTKPFNTITDRLVTLNFERLGAGIKSSLITGRGKITEGIRSTPIPKVDQVLGINNSTVVYNTIFEPIYKAYAKFLGEFDVVNNKVDRAQKLLTTKGKAKNSNEVKKQSLEIGVYLHALESEANQVDGKFSELSPSVKDMLEKTIDYYRRVGNSIDAKTLQEIADKFEQDGDMTAESIFSMLNPGQKQAARILINQNKSLYNLAKSAATRRGRNFVALENYNHRQVLQTQDQKNIDVAAEAELFSEGAGTFAVTLIKRKKGARAINFDAFETVKRGTQETYLDFYMTPDVIKTQDTARELSKKYRRGNRGQVAAAEALISSLRELLQVTYLNTYTQSSTSIVSRFAREAKRIAYRSLLGSAPRFAAEIIGNASMLFAQKPEVISEAFGKYKDISMSIGAINNIKFLNILKNLNSGEIKKLGGQRGDAVFDIQGDTKYSDDNNILNLSQSELGMKGPVAQKMEYLLSLGPKQFYSGISKVSDFLMGGADRVIARPIWISKFANEFKNNVKKYNNEDIDFTVEDFKALQQEKSNSKYLDQKYKKALEEAVSDADRTSIDLVTSGNPLGAIIKNIRRSERGLMDYYRVVNSFMANFTLNEYATARFAVGALFKEGKISQREAALTLAGVLARMSSYVILYKSFANYMDQLFGAPEDEDEDLPYFLQRQLVGSVSTLMFRNSLGNIPSLPINLGIEYINKNYLEKLRNGEPYNAYDNSLVYSLVNLDQLGNKSLASILAPVALGPAGPAFRDFSRVAELAARTQTRKTAEARQRAYDELMDVYTFDVFGQLGLIPFYKDVRRVNRKKFFKDFNKKSAPISKTQLKKINPELYKKLYGPDSPVGKRKKRERELRKRSK